MRPGRAFSLVHRIIWLVVGVTVVTLLLHFALTLAWLRPAGEEKSVRFASELLVSMLVIAIAAGLTLVMGRRWIARPLSALSEQLLLRRDELRPIDEPERVGVEIQGVIRSFNSLVRSVEHSGRSSRELLAGLCHDLRTPLSRLRLRVETECSGVVGAKMEKDFAAVTRIIDQFLAYVQGQGGVSAGKLSLLGELVEEVVARYQEEGARVELTLCSASSLMVPDLGMRRALVNLLDNALAHGRAPVQVELVPQGGEMRLAVFDHGHGIAPADLINAFQPFVRLGNASARRGNSGLGLAIVAQVTQQLGGRTALLAFDGKRSGLAIFLPARARRAGRRAHGTNM